MRGREVAARLALGGLGLVLALLCLELVLQAGAGVAWHVYGRALETALPAEHTLLCLGDSFTYGLGSSGPDHAYPAALERELRRRSPGEWRVVNRGVPGRNSRDVLEQLAGELRSLRPSRVYLLVGANDMWTHPERLAELPAADAGGSGFPWRWRTRRLLALLGSRLRSEPQESAAPPEDAPRLVAAPEEPGRAQAEPAPAEVRPAAPAPPSPEPPAGGQPLVGLWHSAGMPVRMNANGELVNLVAPQIDRMRWRIDGDALVLLTPAGEQRYRWELEGEQLLLRGPDGELAHRMLRPTGPELALWDALESGQLAEAERLLAGVGADTPLLLAGRTELALRSQRWREAASALSALLARADAREPGELLANRLIDAAEAHDDLAEVFGEAPAEVGRQVLDRARVAGQNELAAALAAGLAAGRPLVGIWHSAGIPLRLRANGQLLNLVAPQLDGMHWQMAGDALVLLTPAGEQRYRWEVEGEQILLRGPTGEIAQRMLRPVGPELALWSALASGRQSEAERLLAEASADTPLLLAGRAELALRSQRWREAASAICALLGRADARDPGQLLANRLIGAADAHAALAEALGEAPGEVARWVLDRALASGQRELADALAAELAGRGEADETAWGLVAEERLAAGDQRGALEALKRAPVRTAQKALSDAFAAGQQEFAEALAEHLLERGDTSSLAWTALAQKHYLAGEFPEALVAANRGVELGGSGPERRTALAVRFFVLSQLGSSEALRDAVEVFLLAGDDSLIRWSINRDKASDASLEQALLELAASADAGQRVRERVAELRLSARSADALAVFEQHLRLFVAAVSSAGALPVLLNYPSHGPVDAVIPRVAAETGAHWIDPAPAFERLGEAERAGMFVADGHLSDAGYALLARLLADDLLAQGAGPAAQPPPRRLRGRLP